MNNKFFPLTIIIGSLILGSFFILISKKDQIIPPKQDKIVKEEILIKPVDENDNILGNPNAPIIIIEYSDFECIYCKSFHKTMEKIIDEYGKVGKVAWVFRHFPLEEYHKNAYQAAVASECMSISGNKNLFWDFSSKIFEEAPESLSLSNYSKIATELGLNKEEFEKCLISNSKDAKIKSDIEDGKKLYENDTANFGTPYNIIMTKNGIIKVAGSQPYNVLKEIIDSNL